MAKNLRAVFLISAISFSSVPAMSQTASWDSARISTLMMRIKDFRPKDAFDPAPSQSSLSGQSFTVSWPLKDGSVRNMGITSSGYWTYDTGSSMLTAVVRSSSLSYEPAAYFFQGSVTGGKAYAAQNGFGASANVKRYESTGFGIQSGAQPAAAYELQLNLPANEARIVAASLKVVMQGRFLDRGTSGPVSCEKDSIEPSIQRPIEILMTKCLALASISHVSIVRGDTGQSLREWSLGR